MKNFKELVELYRDYQPRSIDGDPYSHRIDDLIYVDDMNDRLAHDYDMFCLLFKKIEELEDKIAKLEFNKADTEIVCGPGSYDG
jgi:hypothetical protein